ncbi:MAG: hypothetical protein IJ648_03775 [Lachnospiraceae bacterium]|nr:hypothetical protein [Lachnospiraceae bacterium]
MEKNYDKKQYNNWKKFWQEHLQDTMLGTFFEEGTFGDDHSRIGWIGGAGYLITLLIFVAGHMSITKHTQLMVLLLWVAIDLTINGIRHLYICKHTDMDPDSEHEAQEEDAPDEAYMVCAR